MAPTRTIKSKSIPKNGQSSKTSGKIGALGANTKNTKSKVSKKSKGPPPKQQKTKSAAPIKKKKRVYTEKELGVPKLNMITPVGVELPKGKKKGKVFVDDQVGLPCSEIPWLLTNLASQESMMTILAIVNAEKEGQLESKMMKARQMEEIREARRKEAEARQEQRRSKLVWSLSKSQSQEGTDCAVGGDQGITTQEKNKEAQYRSRYDPIREQLEIPNKRKSHSEKGLVRLMLIS